MGVHLIGNGVETTNWEGWRSVLNVGKAFGWQPMGTAQPNSWAGEWEGGYFSNDGQTVIEPDAKALSGALNRAIGAMKKGKDLSTAQVVAVHAVDHETLLVFAEFFARGEFSIW